MPEMMSMLGNMLAPAPSAEIYQVYRIITLVLLLVMMVAAIVAIVLIAQGLMAIMRGLFSSFPKH